MAQTKNKQLLVNLAASVVVFIVQLIIGFWMSPFVVEKLGEEAYGFITLANNFTQYATLLTVAINSMSARYISITYNQGKHDDAKQYFSSVFWMNVILSVVVFVAAAMIIFKIENLINIEPGLVRDVKITFAISFLNLIISFISTCYVASTFVTNRMDIHAYIQIASNLIKVFAIVSPFVFFVPHIYYVSLGTILSTLFIFIVYIFLRRSLLPDMSISIKMFSAKKIIKLAKSGTWILISDISSLLLNGLDLLMANLFVSQIAMGRLSISKQIPTAIGSLLGFLSNIFAASLTSLAALGDKDKLAKEIKFTCKVLGLFLTVPFAGIIIYGIDFFQLWLPANVYNHAAIIQVYVLMMFTLSNVIVNAYMYSIHSLFIAMDKVKVYSIMVLISSLVSIAATIILLETTALGVYAIAATSTIVLSLVNLLLVPLYAEKVLEVKHFTILSTIFRNYVVLFVTAALFFAVKPFTIMNSWKTFFVSVVLIGVCGYALDFFLLLNKEEKGTFINIFKRKLLRR